MAEQEPPEANTAAHPGLEGERLDGWKRIARYLNRDIRTLRRWELNEGLPVHRLLHDKQGTVYAFRSELDTWQAKRSEAAATSSAANRVHGKTGPGWLWLVVPLLLVGTLLAWYWKGGEQSAIAFGERDWVLITHFDNRTGDKALDGTVEYALQRELANSRYIKVVPLERINDALRLMKLPPDTPVDLKVGREISVRDGGIRMLITGRVDKLGNTYQISTELVSPGDGLAVASFDVQASSRDQILPQIGGMAAKVRAALGESVASIRQSREMLAKVTTPSLAALRLFSQANEAMAGPDRARALSLLQEAVRLDPDFASAHLLLWYALRERDKRDLAVQHLERAVALADQTSERERLFILATYYEFLGDEDKSIDTYHVLLRLYPDHYWANGNLANRYEAMGKFAQSLVYKKRVAELRPNSVGWYPDLDIVQLAIVTGDAQGRDFYLDKLKGVADQPGYEWLPTQLTMLPVHEAWVGGNYEQALDRVDAIVAGMDPDDIVARDYLFAHVRSVYLGLGKLQRFRELSKLRTRLGWMQALLDLDSGDPGTMDQYLETADPDYWDATLLALSGQTKRAQAIIDDPRTAKSVRPYTAFESWKSLARGQVALAEGRLQDAVSQLTDYPLILNITSKWGHLFAMHSLARAYEGLGQTDKAIDTLEQASRQKPLAIFEPGGMYMWQRNQLYLHDLYIKAGQTAAADRAARALRQTLQLADPDDPFLKALAGEGS